MFKAASTLLTDDDTAATTPEEVGEQEEAVPGVRYGNKTSTRFPDCLSAIHLSDPRSICFLVKIDDFLKSPLEESKVC